MRGMIERSDIFKDPNDTGTMVHTTCEHFSLLLKNQMDFGRNSRLLQTQPRNIPVKPIVADILPLLD